MAVALPQIEKVIKEKTFYKILMAEYINQKSLGIQAHGFYVSNDAYVVELIVNNELSPQVCTNLSKNICEKYKLFVPENSTEELAKWALSHEGNLWILSVFITSQHDSDLLTNQNFADITRECNCN